MRQRFARDALVPAAWKNGAGRTRPIVVWPTDASIDTFAWRASLATIEGDAAFSIFDGVDRSIVLIDGDVTLAVDGEAPRRLERDAPFAFAGERAIRCATSGTSTDFNAMTRRAGWTHDVRVLDREATLVPSSHGLLLSLAGSWTVDADVFAEGEGVWWADDAGLSRVVPRDRGARLIALRCEPTGASA